MNFAALDWIVLGTLCTVMAVFAVYVKSLNRSVSDFLAANRCAGRYIRAPKDVPIDWDVSGLVPDHAHVWLNGRCINRQLSGHFSGGRLRLEWKP